jgi:hypothetical protein
MMRREGGRVVICRQAVRVMPGSVRLMRVPGFFPPERPGAGPSVMGARPAPIQFRALQRRV